LPVAHDTSSTKLKQFAPTPCDASHRDNVAANDGSASRRSSTKHGLVERLRQTGVAHHHGDRGTEAGRRGASSAPIDSSFEMPANSFASAA